jgi:hypothetical protein
LPSNISVTGGTINVTIPASGTNAHISSTAPFPNFNVNKAGAGAAELVLQQIAVAVSGPEVGATTARPLTVLGDFTLLTGNSPLFNANNQNVTIGGTLKFNQARHSALAQTPLPLSAMARILSPSMARWKLTQAVRASTILP